MPIFLFTAYNTSDLIINSMEKTISLKTVTYDFARLMDGASELKCSEFAEKLPARTVRRMHEGAIRGSHTNDETI